MKRFAYILAIATLAACGDPKPEQPQDPNRLSPDLVSNPRTAMGDNPAALESLPTMDFEDTSHNFGPMKEGETVSYEFNFKNNGKSPLIISSATGSCGCTVPEYPKEPVAPGATGVLKVSFNSASKFGHQEKSITIATNSRKGVHLLYIQAEVDDKK